MQMEQMKSAGGGVRGFCVADDAGGAGGLLGGVSVAAGAGRVRRWIHGDGLDPLAWIMGIVTLVFGAAAMRCGCGGSRMGG